MSLASPRHQWMSLALVLLGPPAVAAQATGTLVGTVVDDTTDEPLRGAALSVSSTGLSTASDANGIYELTPMPAGQIAVRVESPGYAAVVEQIEILPDEVGLFQFRLSRLEVAIRGLFVLTAGRDAPGSRESHVGGLDERFAQTALDLLREKLPGVQVRSRNGGGAGIRIRGASSLQNNDPALYVDGILIADAPGVGVLHALEQIPASRVLRIRVLHGPSAVARYGDANHGVILVETR